jgi:ribosome recycling factor
VLVVTYAKGKKGGASTAVDDGPKGKGGKAGEAVDVAKIEKEAKTDAVSGQGGVVTVVGETTLHCCMASFCVALQEDRMKKAISVLADSFNTIRTGRANPAILDKIMVGVPNCVASMILKELCWQGSH